ncbi:MAG: MucB/RseB C-terminal domain-containing protein [Pseudomonadota bacterium]
MMRRTVPFCLLAALAAANPSGAAAEAAAEQPAVLLERMSRSLQALEYEGVFVYVRDGRVDAVQVTRIQGVDGPVDRLVTLSGDRRELFRAGAELRCLTPRGMVTATLVPRLELSAPEPAQVTRLAQSYRFSVAGADRVAGFEATVLDAEPLDSDRYAFRLWLERASGMLLASMVRAPDGEAVEQLAFTSLRLRESGLAAREAAAAAAPVDPSGWQVGALPTGFRLIARPQSAKDSEHLLFSDGLASLSVYIEPSGGGLVGPARRGAVNAYGRALQDAHVVVVGDLPAATVARIAGAVRRAP